MKPGTFDLVPSWNQNHFKKLLGNNNKLHNKKIINSQHILEIYSVISPIFAFSTYT